MELEDSFLNSTEPITIPSPEAVESSPYSRLIYITLILSGLAPHNSSTQIIFGVFARLGAIGSLRKSWRSFLGAWLLGAWPTARGPATESRSPFNSSR
jgi:hypothetical protein